MKKVFKYFYGAIDMQKNWLNKMSAKGYKLVDVGKFSYTFAKCMPGEYVYEVEFIAHKSYKDGILYSNKLKKLGYEVIFKNINIGWSIMKNRFRPWGEGKGKISSNPGNYNRELMIIVKKNDGKGFEGLEKNVNLRRYYSYIRNAWLYNFSFILVVLGISAFFIKGIVIDIMLLIIAILLGSPVLYYQSQIKKVTKMNI